MNKNLLAISFLACLLLVYRKTIGFCKLILYPGTLLKVLIIPKSSLEAIFRFIIHNISHANSDNLIYLPICIPLISFSYFIGIAWTSAAWIADSIQSCLIPDFN